MIVREINKIADTRCHILKLKCTKFKFGWGAYSAPPDPLAGFKGPTSKGRGGKGKGGKGKGREGKGREGKRGRRGRGGKGGALRHFSFYNLSTGCCYTSADVMNNIVVVVGPLKYS